MARVIRTSRRSTMAHEEPRTIEGAPVCGLAWACLVSALLGWIFGIPLVLSLVLGLMALSEIRHHRGRLRGRGIVYLAFGIDVVVFGMLFTAFVLPQIRGYHEKVCRVHCEENLERIGAACRRYARDRADRRFPDDLGILFERGDLVGKHFVCTSSFRTPPPVTAAEVREGRCSYTYLGKGLRLNSPNLKYTILAYDRQSHRLGPFFNVLLADGSVYGVEADSIEAACKKYRWIRPGEMFRPPGQMVKKQRPRRQFPEDKCELRLPSADWEWQKGPVKPGIKATGIHPERGLIIDLAVERVNTSKAITEPLMTKFEQGVLAKPGTNKVARRALTFRGIPAYELTYTLDNGQTTAIARVFCANSRIYMVQVSGNAGDMARLTDIDDVMNSFRFTSRPRYRP